MWRNLTSSRYFSGPSGLLIRILVLPVVLSFGSSLSAAEWQSLFNGRDFTNWEARLGPPDVGYEIPGVPRDKDGTYKTPLGLNDPLRVFSVVVVDGKPALRITGEMRGAFVTEKSFSNYRFRAQYKWGRGTWGIRPVVRNGGLNYHVWGDPGDGSAAWIQAHPNTGFVEYETTYGGIGDFMALRPVTGILRSRPGINPKLRTGTARFQYDVTGAPRMFHDFPGSPNGRRVTGAVDAEKAVGEWNTVEIVCYNDRVAHYLNGELLLVATDLRRTPDAGLDAGPSVPITQGRIEFQSEGSEMFWRAMEILPLDEMPPELATTSGPGS